MLNNQNEDEAAFISHVKYYKKCENGHGFGVITMEMRHLHFMALQIEVRQVDTDLQCKLWWPKHVCLTNEIFIGFATRSKVLRFVTF